MQLDESIDVYLAELWKHAVLFHGNPVKFDILVTHERLLGHDLLIGMNTIKEMGGNPYQVQ